MANWLKWCKGLARKSQVLEISKMLGRSRHEVAGLCMEVWEWAEDNAFVEEASADRPGFVRITSTSGTLVDDFVGVSGLADAMVSVGWLAVRNGHLEFPKFSRHNGSHAKRRALDAERNRLNRVRKASAFDADDLRGTKNGVLSIDSSKDVNSSKRKKIPEEEYPKSFEAFWLIYPRKEGKRAAFNAWKRAGKRIKDGTGKSGLEAAEHMRKAAEAFAASDKAKGEFCPHASTWLNQGRYDDDPAAWKDRKSNGKHDPVERFSVSLTDNDL